MVKIHKDLEQRSMDWFKARNGKLSGSRVTPLMAKKGLGAGARTLALEIVAEMLIGMPEDTPTTWAMERGIELEEDAFDIYEANYPDVYGVGGIENDGLFFSPDGVVGEDGLLEIKSPMRKQHMVNLTTDDWEMAYYDQLQFGLMVSERKWIDLVSFHPDFPDNNAFKVKRITPDLEYITLMRERIAAFNVIVEHILKNLK